VAGRIAARWQHLRDRLRARQDSEHEQALIRLGVGILLYAYLLLILHHPDEHAEILRWVSLVYLVDLLAAAGILLHILQRPAANPRRRLLAILVDATALNATMLLGGPAASALYPVLLWIILGHGFRYGQLYLWAAAGLSAGLFGLVVAVSPAWREIPALAVALVASLVVLPVYFAVLLRKLQRAIARAEEASRAKGHFLAAMSHELRTPLNAIIGMSELLGTTGLDGEQRDMAGTIRDAARSLLGLVDQVLDLARIEAGRLEIAVEPFDLHDSLARLRAMLGPLAAGKGLHLRLRLAAETPFALRGGARPLHQALVNLVGNAIKFTDRGGVTVHVRPTLREQGQVRLRFEVEDTGIGLTPAVRAQLFQRFARGEESRRRGIGGTGLGLSITRELVELMGGTIGAVGAPGAGSTFWFELPLELDVGAVPDGPEARRLSGLVVVIGAREAAGALAARAEAFGCRTRCVATAEAAVELAHRGPDRAALLVTERMPPVDVPALAGLLAGTGTVEPVDIVTVDLAPGADATPPTLADLPGDAGDAALFACLRAALRRPAGEGGEQRVPQVEASRSLRVLVAEDNRVNQKVIGKTLEHAGHRPTIVASGQAAIEALEQQAFDVVLMDINMPEMSGIEAVKLLRFGAAPGPLPPIVALSADATPQTRAACRSVGFSAYLTKPVDTALLLRTLAELTGTREGEAPEPPEPAAGSALRHGPTAGEREEPAIDRAKLASLAELDRGDGFLAGLIEDFAADARALLGELERAAAAGDPRTFRDHAHALRSSAAHIGAVALFQLCLGWRGLDDHALLLRAPADLVWLGRELDRAVDGLRAFRRERLSDP
jgi:two-component system sensor histidine kinase RpfC